MCRFVKTDGNQCKLSPKKDLCHKHINSVPAPVAEPVAEEFIAKIRSLSFEATVAEQKKEDSELIPDEKEIVETNIVPPTSMSPNATPTSSTPAILDSGKSEPVKINSKPFFDDCKAYLKDNAIGTWYESYTIKEKDSEVYLHKPMRGMSLLRVEHEEGARAKVKGARRFYWIYNSKDAQKFNEYVAMRLKGECHEMFVSPRTRMFFDIDLKMDEMEKNDFAEAMGYPLEEGGNERAMMDMVSEKLAVVYSDAIAISLEENGALDDINHLDWMATTRNRALEDDGFKISIHESDALTRRMLGYRDACSRARYPGEH